MFCFLFWAAVEQLVHSSCPNSKLLVRLFRAAVFTCYTCESVYTHVHTPLNLGHRWFPPEFAFPKRCAVCHDPDVACVAVLKQVHVHKQFVECAWLGRSHRGGLLLMRLPKESELMRGSMGLQSVFGSCSFLAWPTGHTDTLPLVQSA